MTTTTEQTTALRVYEPYTDIREQIAELAVQNEKAVFDYADPDGEKMARSHIWKIRQLKGPIKDRHKELKEQILEDGRKLDAVKKELTAMVDAMIAVHETPLLEIKAKEEKRLADIDEAIEAIKHPGLDLDARSSAGYDAAIKRLEAIEIDADTYQERMAEAVKLKAEELDVLQRGRTELLRVEAEQAELERLRREAAAREQAEREERIRAEAEAKAKREAAEAAAKANAESERRERELKEKAERAEREAAEATQRAEREKREAVEAEQRRQRETEQARQREIAKAKAEEEKRAANKRHRAKVIKDAEEALIESGVDRGEAVNAIEAIASGKVPNVSIQF